jgi:hypothetical protein
LSGPEDEQPLPVGSLAKPFVTKAWARSHPRTPTPRLQCTSTSSCWLPSGHGHLGLARAIAASCNAYFRTLAAATPEDMLRQVLREEGFLVPSPLTANLAIGADGALAIRPGALLRAYLRLTQEPWAEGDAVRSELLAGLRDNAWRGTARGLARYGLWAKTGTVPALDGRALRTSGLTLAVDDAGFAVLGVLPRGTGREAASALAAAITRMRTGSDHDRAEDIRRPRADRTLGGADDRVSVALFVTLRPRTLVARNLGNHPLQTSRGYLGPSASVSLRPGDRLSEGRWRLSVPSLRFHRDVLASLSCAGEPDGSLRLRADMAAPEYVAGVLSAELAGGEGPLRTALGAAVLRFLADGPRHGATHVCDSTHCAWFIGRGPAVSWPTARAAILSPRPGDAIWAPPLDAASWQTILRGSRQPGPRQWTSHCGGRPLSAHAVWGIGDLQVWACGRHPHSSAPWSRVWRDSDLARVYGGRVESVALTEDDGVWRLALRTSAGTEAFDYDEIHRRLAAVLGWGALPSPATAVAREPGGWRVSGFGLGHRVGLCLGGQGGAMAGGTVDSPH